MITKKKKYLIYIIGALIFISFLIGINKLNIKAEDIEHTHIWTTTYDGTNHWEYCTVCKTTRNVATHQYTDHWALGYESCYSTNYSTRVCDCGYSYTYHKPHTKPDPIVWRSTGSARATHYYSCVSCGNWLSSGKCANETGVLSCKNPGVCSTCNTQVSASHHYISGNKCSYCGTIFMTYDSPNIVYSDDYLSCVYTFKLYPQNGYVPSSAPSISHNANNCKQSYTRNLIDNGDGSYTCEYNIIFNRSAQRKENVVFGDGVFGSINGVSVYNNAIYLNQNIWQDHTAPVISNITTVDQTSSNSWATIKEFTIEGTDDFSDVVYITITDKTSGKVYLNSAATTVTSNNYKYVCTPSVEASESGRTYVITVKDKIGNTSSQEITIYKTDGTAPEVESSLSYTDWTNTGKTITLTIIDYGSGTPLASLGNQTSYAPCTKVGEKYQVTYTFDNEITGTQTYKLYLRDGLGNATVYDLVVGNIDKTPPMISSIASSGANTESSLTVTAKDTNGSGITHYAISTTQSIASNAWVTSNKLTIPNTGTYYIGVKDKAGNITTSKINTYAFTIKDVEQSTNKALGQKQFYKLNGTTVNANILGSNTADNAYYNKYYYLSSTSATLNGANATIYRYFALRTTSLNVSLVFNDNNNQKGDRPTSVGCVLYANGTSKETKNVTINNTTNSYTCTFNNISKYDDNGKVITYTSGLASEYRKYQIDTSQANKFVFNQMDSTFSVIIPKTVIVGGQNKTGQYEVQVKGFISKNETLSVTPSTQFVMKSANKNDITATVTQEKTSFKYNEINDANYTKIKGTIKADKLTAGLWQGFFNFTIKLQ